MSQAVFQVGQKVTWRDPTGCAIAYLIKQYQWTGPFLVTSIEEVPDTCNCGGALNDGYHSSGGCPYTSFNKQYGKPVRQTVGHSQWLFVTDASGVQITGKFSGAYFKPVEG